MTIQRSHCSGNEKNKLKQQCAVNMQNTKENLKILFRILLLKTLLKITSLLHTHDLSLYAWEQIDTVRISTSEDSRILQRSVPLFRSTPLNPYLRHCHPVHAFGRYRVPDASILVYSVVTLRRIFAQSCISWRGVIFTQDRNISNWRRVNWSALVEGQEVES